MALTALGEARRIWRDDVIRLRVLSSLTNIVNLNAQVLFDDGGTANVPVQVTPAGTRGIDTRTSAKMTKSGWVTNLRIAPVGGGPRRGNMWMIAQVASQSAGERDTLAKGYAYAENPLMLGEMQDAGPGGGNGDINNRAIAEDIAPADIQSAFAATNTLRRIDGFVWYYHCSSDVANRTLRVSIRDLGNGLPTGMTSGGNTLAQLWPSAAVLTLTSNQEGMILVTNQFAVSVDTGTPTFEDPSARPNPFPYWVQPDDVGEFFFDVTDEEAADRHSIWVFQEEWMMV